MRFQGRDVRNKPGRVICILLECSQQLGSGEASYFKANSFMKFINLTSRALKVYCAYNKAL